MCHPYGKRALCLTAVDRHYAAADDLRHICAGVDRNDDYTRGYQRKRLPAVHKGVAPEDHNGLHHHRRAAEYFDIYRDKRVDYPLQHAQRQVARFRRGADNACHKPDQKPGKRACERYEKRVFNAAQKLRIILDGNIYDFVEEIHCLYHFITTRLEV